MSTDSSGRAVRIAAMIWGGSILLSRVIGLIREAVLGRVLGGGADADAYFAAFRPGDFLNYLLAAGALSIVFIPLFNAHWAKQREDDAWTSFSIVANANLLVLAVAIPAMWFGAPTIADLITPGFEGPQQELVIRLVRIMLPAQAFHVIGGLLSATLQARDKHTLPALAPLVYTLGIIAGGWFTGTADGFAWGVLLGSVLGPFGLPLVGCIRAGMRWRPVFSWSHPDLRAWLVRSLPIMLGFSIVAVDDWVLSNQGSYLEPGAIASLTYAKSLMKVPMGVFGLATGVAAYPTLTRLVGAGKPGEAYALLARSTRTVVVLAIGAQVALTAAGPEIAAVIYGSRMDPAQHLVIGYALALFGLGLWAWAAQTVVARGFYVLGQTWPPTVLGTLAVVVTLPLYIAMRSTFGVLGLPVATTVAISVYVISLIVVLRRRFPGTEDGYGRFALRIVPALVLGLLVAVLGRVGIQSINLPAFPGQSLVVGATLGTVALGAYGVTARWLGVAEVAMVTDRIIARLRRRRRAEPS